ncbi:dienelactone hydrolase family protein [Streptomyces harbinensis]|uniref:dienelactone hydrolase family protein n=1 Tax=Streptomyces harbinensis TaxID=1176198 RepID=UPI003398449A
MTASLTNAAVPTPDGTADAYLAHPGDGGPYPAVLMYMDAFGIRPHLVAMADRLAAAGCTVLVPNVLYRQGPAPLLDLPERIDTAARPDLFERLGPALRALTPDAVRRDAGACLDWLAASPLTTGGPVAVTGYCFGAGLALRTAGGFPDRVAAVAGFHGARLATEAEDSPHRLAGRITAEVYFGHADQDAALPPEQIDRLDAALARAGVRYRTEVYRGARHGFTQADTVAYDPAADARHWRALLGLLDRTFPGRGIGGDGAR